MVNRPNLKQESSWNVRKITSLIFRNLKKVNNFQLVFFRIFFQETLQEETTPNIAPIAFLDHLVVQERLVPLKGRQLHVRGEWFLSRTLAKSIVTPRLTWGLTQSQDQVGGLSVLFDLKSDQLLFILGQIFIFHIHFSKNIAKFQKENKGRLSQFGKEIQCIDCKGRNLQCTLIENFESPRPSSPLRSSPMDSGSGSGNNNWNQDDNETEVNQPVRCLHDYLQPTSQTTPLCMIMPTGAGQFEIKPGVIQLLLKFHGLDSESAYLHLREFE